MAGVFACEILFFGRRGDARKKRDWQGPNRTLSYSRVEHKCGLGEAKVTLYFLCRCNAQSEHNPERDGGSHGILG
jgi:hypothetical protein